MKIYIWGSGNNYKLVKTAINSEICEIIGIIDNNPEKVGTVLDENIILSAEDIEECFDYIIISVSNFNAIYFQIEKMNISKDKVIRYFSDEDCLKYKDKELIDFKQWKIDILEERVRKLEWELTIRTRNIGYELSERVNFRNDIFPKFRSNDEAIEKIINCGCSIIRFGDGEFNIISGRDGPVFQESSEELGKRLFNVLNSDYDNLLIAIAKNYGDLSIYPDEVADGIRNYLTEEVRRIHYSYLNMDRYYYDAYMFKCFIPHKDKENTIKRINRVKKIWQNRDVVIIEGDKTRTGVGNNLFDNVASLKRILCPTNNSFKYYAEILGESKKIDKYKLILIALGPAGKVLGYDLFKCGYQIIDIGQIDMDYDWYLSGARCKVGNKYKYISQLPKARVYEIEDSNYLSQIIKSVGIV